MLFCLLWLIIYVVFVSVGRDVVLPLLMMLSKVAVFSVVPCHVTPHALAKLSFEVPSASSLAPTDGLALRASPSTSTFSLPLPVLTS